MTIGIITEGLTDQVVLRHIVRAVINHQGERALVSTLAPLDTEPHGYPKVFDYITSYLFRELLIPKDDCIVIQIDTDTRDKWMEFFQATPELHSLLKEILSVKDDTEDAITALVEQVSALLIRLIGLEYYEGHKDQIIFAICVHEMECWLLPYHGQNKSDRLKTVGCVTALSRAFKPGTTYLDPNKKNHNNSKYYQLALKSLPKKRDILAKYHHNTSLKLFVDRIIPLAPAE